MFDTKSPAIEPSSPLVVVDRRYFLDMLEGEIRRSSQFFFPLTVLMLNLNRFKHINQTLGHSVGNEILREFTQRIKTVVGHEGVFARYGGVEFALMLSETDAKMAEGVVKRCHDAVNDSPFRTTAGNISCTVSIGGSTLSDESCLLSGSELIHQAYQDLCISKKSERNHIFSEVDTENDLLS